ncbi:MAG: ATP-binding protein [Prevotellaceae bacterium]|jgi:predicted ATPase|nr:ATP-binding protein [Prevotellaceae bacterium]
MKIKIKNVGPIRQGFTAADGYMEIKDLTVFIGNQGAGKSTVTKLISTLCWLEKTLFRNYIKESDLKKENFFKNHCRWHRLENYLTTDSYIHFVGHCYEFTYENNIFSMKPLEKEGYLVPQIMYVPAERNFLSTVDRPRMLKALPTPLYTFLDEFETAENVYKDGIELPLDGDSVRFEYSPQNKLAYIRGNGYRIRLSEASSGIQSMAPLFIVSQYLANSILKKKEEDAMSLEKRRKIEAEIESILLNKELSEEVKMLSLKTISAKYGKGCFFNIIEEVEQNLFPTSQRLILFQLIALLNLTKGNRLLVNTHSPYIINYLILAVKAAQLFGLTPENEETKEAIKHDVAKIVPVTSCIESDRVAVYEITNDGAISALDTVYGMPSDDNYLNNLLEEVNTLYSELQEIEEKYEA